MEFDAERVRANVQAARSEDLIERATIFREQMEPDALPIIDEELSRRGVSKKYLDAQRARYRDIVVRGADGTPARCSFCDRAAVASRRDWHRLCGLIPVFPRLFFYCGKHKPSGM